MYEKNNTLRKTVGELILTTHETEALLGLTRQTINTLIKNGELPVLKTTTNGNLFLKADIELYRAKRLKLNYDSNRVIEGNSNTFDTMRLFEEMKDRYHEIDSIYIYFSGDLALMDGYVARTDTYVNEMMMLTGPTFVVHFADGGERWFNGFNCGYGGTGPNGSVKALMQLGVNEADAKKVYNSNRIFYVKKEGEWKAVDCHKEGNDALTHMNLFSRNGNLIMLQNSSNITDKDRDVLNFLNKYMFFIPEPVGVELLSREEALEKNYYGGSPIHPTCYQIIITDISGRQIWIDYPVKKMRMKYDATIKEILEMIGFGLPEETESLYTQLKFWINKTIRIKV